MNTADRAKKDAETTEPKEYTINDFPMLQRCQEKAGTMPHFVVVASDDFAIDTIHHWIKNAEAAGVNPAKILEAKKIIGAISRWRADNHHLCKLPD